MTRFKTMLLTSSMMTAAERAKGRFMRAPDGHDGGEGTPAPAPAPAAEAAPAETPEQEEARVAAELEAEFAPPEADSNAEEGEQKPEAPKPAAEEKPVHSVEERIAEATRLQREAERDAAEARRVLAEERAKAAPTSKEGEDSIDPDAAPDPANYDYGEADPKFIADVATHAANLAYQRNAQAAEMRAQISDMEAKWQGELAKPEVIERYPDFDEVVTKTADAGEWDCTPLMAIGIKQSPVGIDVAYHLATNKPEAARIAKLPPMEQALEFGRLEGRFMATAAAPKTEPTPAKTTSAPTPPASRARGAGGQFATPADTDDFASFDKMADGLIKKTR